MERSKKILFLCHCILNSNTKVEGLAKSAGIEKKIADIILANNIGIVQLPCPEFMCYGIKRWGHVKSQFDTPHFRDQCRIMFKPYYEQILNYLQNGYDVIGIVGIEGSPSCGVSKTCEGNWGGEWTKSDQWQKRLDTVRSIPGEGIFIQEIKNMLSQLSIDIPLYGISFSNIPESQQNISKIIEQNDSGK